MDEKAAEADVAILASKLKVYDIILAKQRYLAGDVSSSSGLPDTIIYHVGRCRTLLWLTSSIFLTGLSSPKLALTSWSPESSQI